MHGGATAIFAVMGTRDARATRRQRARRARVASGLRHRRSCCTRRSTTLLISPTRCDARASSSCCRRCSTWCSERSEKAVGDWLGQGLRRRHRDARARSTPGACPIRRSADTCTTLKAKFRGPVVADLLCYLRLYTELALRAKGILMMRESGFDVPGRRGDAGEVRRDALSRIEHRQDGPARDPADVPHEPQGPVAALHARRLKSGRPRSSAAGALLANTWRRAADRHGWGGRIRTFECRNQNPVP